MSVKSNKMLLNDGDFNHDGLGLFVNENLFGFNNAYGIIPSILSYEVKNNQDESDWFAQNVATAQVVGRTSSSSEDMIFDDETTILASHSNSTTSYLDKSSKTFYSDSSELTSSESYEQNGMETYLNDTHTRLMIGKEETFSDYHSIEQIKYSDGLFTFFTDSVTDGTLQSNETEAIINLEHSEQTASNFGFTTGFDNFFENIAIAMSNNGDTNISFEMQLESTEINFDTFSANQLASSAEGFISLADGEISLEFDCATLSLAAGKPETTSFRIDNLTSSDDFVAALNGEEVPYQIAAAVENLVDIATNIQSGGTVDFSDITTIGVEQADIYDVA